MKRWLLSLSVFALSVTARAQTPPANTFVRDNFKKMEVDIPMRDGVKLHTNIYVPKDASVSSKYPFLMQRTCYSVAPYGPDAYPNSLGPSGTLLRDKYIFVYQDVRGRWMSEGTWTNMTPTVTDGPSDATQKKRGKAPARQSAMAVDESSDNYDTIEWHD